MTKQRIHTVMNRFEENNIDSLFITSKANVYYFSNYYTDPHERVVAVYISKYHDPVLIVPAMEVEDAKNAGWAHHMIQYEDHENVWELFLKFVQKHEAVPQALGLEFNEITLERFNTVKQILPKTIIHDTQEMLAQLRVIKNEQEYELLKEAARLADYGIEVGIQAVQEGVAELEIIAEIEYALKKSGVQEMSFSTMALSGNKTASPHGTPNMKKITKGDLVLFDLGVVYEGYCSDITRTVAYQIITKEQEKIYNTVLAAEEKAIKTAQNGTKVGQIDQAARGVIEDAGYGSYFTHRVGHGLGIDVHEYPSMHQDNNLKLKPGMCFTIEPGIYVPKVGGVRIEDMIFMTPSGPETLTASPKQLQIID